MPRLSSAYQAVLRASVSSVKLSRVPRTASDLFFRLLLLSDSFGRFVADPFQVAAAAYPKQMSSGAVTTDEVRSDLEALRAADLIRRYDVGEETFLEVVDYYDPAADSRRRALFPDPGQSVSPTRGQPVPAGASIGDRRSVIGDRGSEIGGVGGSREAERPVPESGTSWASPAAPLPSAPRPAAPQGGALPLAGVGVNGSGSQEPPSARPPLERPGTRVSGPPTESVDPAGSQEPQRRKRRKSAWRDYLTMDPLASCPELLEEWTLYNGRYRPDLGLTPWTATTCKRNLAVPPAQLLAALKQAIKAGWHAPRTENFLPDGRPVSKQVNGNGSLSTRESRNREVLDLYLGKSRGDDGARVLDVNGRASR